MALNDRKQVRERFSFGRGHDRNFSMCDPVKLQSRDHDRNRVLTTVVPTLPYYTE